jgi:hypothetical protein
MVSSRWIAATSAAGPLRRALHEPGELAEWCSSAAGTDDGTDCSVLVAREKSHLLKIDQHRSADSPFRPDIRPSAYHERWFQRQSRQGVPAQNSAPHRSKDVLFVARRAHGRHGGAWGSLQNSLNHSGSRERRPAPPIPGRWSANVAVQGEDFSDRLESHQVPRTGLPVHPEGMSKPEPPVVAEAPLLD